MIHLFEYCQNYGSIFLLLQINIERYEGKNIEILHYLMKKFDFDLAFEEQCRKIQDPHILMKTELLVLNSTLSLLLQTQVSCSYDSSLPSENSLLGTYSEKLVEQANITYFIFLSKYRSMDVQKNFENRLFPDGERWEYSTETHDLFLEYHNKTLIISLNAETKFFRRVICDVGKHRYRYNEYHQAEEIFSWFKNNSIEKNDQSYLSQGILFFHFRRIELKQVKLGGKMLKQVQANWNLKRRRKKLAEMCPEQLEKFVDKTTPSSKYFHIKDNIIRRQSDDGSFRMVLVDAVAGEGVLAFRTHVHTNKRWFCVGVTDRLTQRDSDYAQPEYSIKYVHVGRISYATGDGKYNIDSPKDEICEGTYVVVEVDRSKCTVTFTLEGGHREGKRQYQVIAPILHHSHGQFVPCFQMDKIGTTVTWQFL